MNKKLLFGIPIMAIILVGAVAAYTILTTTSHINIVENQDIQYYNGTEWISFPLNTGAAVELDATDIGAGDYQDFAIRGINPNKREIQYTMVLTSPDTNVTTDFVCSTTGIQYWKEIVGTTTTIKLLNPAGATSDGIIRTTVDAGAPLTTDVQVSTVVDRLEPEAISWITCP